MGERIRIIDVPPGQAPEWVRQQWVGLELPVAEEPRDDQEYTQLGARGGNPENIGGYRIKADIAFDALRQRSPLAVTWWEAHAPHAFLPSSSLVFRRDVCEIAPETSET